MTNAEFAILSLIAEQPRYGYEIEQVIEMRGMREWTEIGFSSIYFLLKKLETAGLIESRLEPAPGRGPARKVYAITSAGQEAWKATTLQALSTPHPYYPPIQIGLTNLAGLSIPEAVSALQEYRQRLEAQRAHVAGRWEAQRPLPLFVDATFEHGLALMDAELDWLATFIPRLSQEQNSQ